jgi:hypothetical protein
MVMDSRSQFLLQLLEKLGAPLMKAIQSQDTAADEAQTIAALLSETVKISISLSQAMNLKTEDGDADAIRVGLAALAGQLVAESYAKNAAVPGDAEAQKITKALQSVLAFSDNFAPAAEHTQRLQTLEGTPPFFDPVQTNLYAINALVPAIAAISEFPFGQSETQLIVEVAEKLQARANALKDSISTNDAASSKMADMVILQSLAQIYAAAHRAQTEHLKSLPEDQRGNEPTMQPVWDRFDRQLAMLEILLSAMSDGAVRGGRGGGKKPAVEAPVSETPAETTPAVPAAPANPTPPPAKPAGGSPMSFFKKP